MKTIVEVEAYTEDKSLSNSSTFTVKMCRESPKYRDVLLEIGDGKDVHVKLDDLYNAVSVLVFEKELLSGED